MMENLNKYVQNMIKIEKAVKSVEKCKKKKKLEPA